MRVGVDFDNTIVCYDQIFYKVARERALVPAEVAANKGSVRDYLRRCGREDDWTELQGYIYGSRMAEAAPFSGVLDFFALCRERRVGVNVISHRTRYPFRGPRYDLHQAARDWLESQGFYDRLTAEQVYFGLTKADKLERIARAGCTCFIDDLPEFLGEPGFPGGVKTILFDPNGSYPAERRFIRAASWAGISEIIFCEKSKG